MLFDSNDHALAGIENDNRLVKMTSTAKSIPYSISLELNGAASFIIINNLFVLIAVK